MRKWRISPLHCMFFPGLIVGSRRERLVMHVPTHFILFFSLFFFLPNKLCANGVRNAPQRFVWHTSPQKRITKHLQSIWKWLVKVSHNRPRPHRVTCSGEVGWEVSGGDGEKPPSHQVKWLTGDRAGMPGRSMVGGTPKRGRRRCTTAF